MCSQFLIVSSFSSGIYISHANFIAIFTFITSRLSVLSTMKYFWSLEVLTMNYCLNFVWFIGAHAKAVDLLVASCYFIGLSLNVFQRAILAYLSGVIPHYSLPFWFTYSGSIFIFIDDEFFLLIGRSLLPLFWAPTIWTVWAKLVLSFFSTDDLHGVRIRAA